MDVGLGQGLEPVAPCGRCGDQREGFNTTQPQVDAALTGLGIALLPEDELMAHIEAGQLMRVLEDWCPKFEGYHLYYPSRRQPSPAFSLVVQALRLGIAR